MNHTDDLFIPINNRLADDDDDNFDDATGLEAAIDVLSVAVGKGAAKTDEHPERRQKVTVTTIHGFYVLTLSLSGAL